MDSRPLMLCVSTSATEEIGDAARRALHLPVIPARSKAGAFAARCSPAAATGHGQDGTFELDLRVTLRRTTAP
jgi:hypothetical protein